MTNRDTDPIEQLLIPGVDFLTVFRKLLRRVIESRYSREPVDVLYYFLRRYAPRPKRPKRPRELFKKVIKEIRTRRLLYQFNSLFGSRLKFLTTPGEAATPDPH